jgi:hypothetical protein
MSYRMLYTESFGSVDRYIIKKKRISQPLPLMDPSVLALQYLKRIILLQKRRVHL